MMRRRQPLPLPLAALVRGVGHGPAGQHRPARGAVFIMVYNVSYNGK